MIASMETIFTKIRDGVIPSTKLYQDDKCFVILDINPVHKGHALVISNEPYRNIDECPEDVLKHLIGIVKKVEKKQQNVLNCDGSNILINNNPASGQEVPHLHIHVVPRFNGDKAIYSLTHETYKDGEMAQLGTQLKLED